MQFVELNPKIARHILNNAKLKGISVEIYLREIIQTEEDAKIALMREALDDELFTEDLAETLEDFKHTDFEQR